MTRTLGIIQITLGIVEAWIPSIKKHNSRSKQAYDGATSNNRIEMHQKQRTNMLQPPTVQISDT